MQFFAKIYLFFVKESNMDSHFIFEQKMAVKIHCLPVSTKLLSTERTYSYSTECGLKFYSN